MTQPHKALINSSYLLSPKILITSLILLLLGGIYFIIPNLQENQIITPEIAYGVIGLGLLGLVVFLIHKNIVNNPSSRKVKRLQEWVNSQYGIIIGRGTAVNLLRPVNFKDKIFVSQPVMLFFPNNILGTSGTIGRLHQTGEGTYQLVNNDFEEFTSSKDEIFYDSSPNTVVKEPVTVRKFLKVRRKASLVGVSTLVLLVVGVIFRFVFRLPPGDFDLTLATINGLLLFTTFLGAVYYIVLVRKRKKLLTQTVKDLYSWSSEKYGFSISEDEWGVLLKNVKSKKGLLFAFYQIDKDVYTISGFPHFEFKSLEYIFTTDNDSGLFYETETGLLQEILTAEGLDKLSNARTVIEETEKTGGMFVVRENDNIVAKKAYNGEVCLLMWSSQKRVNFFVNNNPERINTKIEFISTDDLNKYVLPEIVKQNMKVLINTNHFNEPMTVKEFGEITEFLTGN